MKEIKNIEFVIKEYFKAFPLILAAYLHGSMANGNARSGSDIDLGIMFLSGKVDKLKFLDIASDLELKLKRIVDIGIVSSDNLVYSKESINNGICLFSANEILRKTREAELLAMYVDFNFERREVINAYRN